MSDAWVCPECGLDYGTLHPPFAINTIKSFPRRFTEALEPAAPSEDNEAMIRTRPAPDVWSAIEYTAHVADLMDEFAVVIHRIYSEASPTIGFSDPDEKAASEKWNELPTEPLLGQLKANCAALVAEADRIDGAGWIRKATFPWGERDLLTMLQNAAHEGVHHLKDVEKVLTRVRSAS
ncbi:MAG: DinB family protein [Actinobacteria bacterium]|nr:DinB family protein [Actinomycetota bacterium]